MVNECNCKNKYQSKTIDVCSFCQIAGCEFCIVYDVAKCLSKYGEDAAAKICKNCNRIEKVTFEDLKYEKQLNRRNTRVYKR